MDDRRRDGGTKSTLRTKEQGTHLTLNEHDDDDVVTQIFSNGHPRACTDILKGLIFLKKKIDKQVQSTTVLLKM